MTIDEFSKSLIERAIAELDEEKNKEGKEQGADGKACWKGYKYAGTENGKDKCVKSEEVEETEKEEKGEKKHKEGKEEEKKELKSEARDMPGNQEKIDTNKNGKVDAHDFALLRARKGKKSVKEMWQKAAEVQEGYGKAKKSLKKEEVVDEGKKVEIEIMPNVDTPNDPEPPTGKKTKKELKKEEASGKEENKFHKKLDKLVHKTFGHSSDEKKKEMKKEEVEELEEKKLSKAEAAKKEKFVKGMKKKFGSFKSKYGDKAKEVMYATATKMGKKAA